MFFTYQENAEVFCFDHKKKKTESITKFSFEGVQIQAAHMRGTLCVLFTSTGYLVIIIFKPHKHYLVTAKLEEGIGISLLEVIGNNNYIFVQDSKNQAYIISINQEYVKKQSFEFSISTKEDFFLVQRVDVPTKDDSPVKFVRIIDGAVEKPTFVTRFISDSEGRLYTFKLPSNQPSTVDLDSLQNYLRSHNFDYRALYLPSSTSSSLEKLIKSPKGKFDVS